MRESDVIVIGGGFAGLIAAIAAAKRGKSVTMLSLGAGTLSIGGGAVDILGYSTGPVDNPLVSMQELDENHPYRKAGKQAVQDAAAFFIKLCQEEGFDYHGSLDGVKWLLTAAGTLKPSCLVPLTLDPEPLNHDGEVIVVGFTGLKDYFPELVIGAIQQYSGKNKQCRIVMIDPNLGAGRDIAVLDIARWLDTVAGRETILTSLKPLVNSGTVVVVPPVLGIRPDYRLVNLLHESLCCRFVETLVIPTAVTGLRLRALLVNQARRLGVRIIEKANVIGSILEKGRCKAVITKNMDRERKYHAQAFILATGGFFGGGLTAGPDFVEEPIFHLPIEAPVDRERWGEYHLFNSGVQPFALIGIRTNAAFRPVDTSSKILLENVFVAGRNLAGYDYCYEKSGNGVALVSGYVTGMSV